MTALFPILLVEDEAEVVDILNRIASRSFPEAKFIPIYSFTEAVSYLDGLRGRGPRLILLDINLHSDLTGLDFLSRLRAHPQGRLVPVVVLSSSESSALKQEAYGLGANAFMSKPEGYAGWKELVSHLRTYWFDVVSIPKLWFEKEGDDQQS